MQAGREMEQETHTREHAEEPQLVSLGGGDAGQEETHTRRKGKEKDELLACTILHYSLSYICQEEDACQQELPSRGLTQVGAMAMLTKDDPHTEP